MLCIVFNFFPRFLLQFQRTFPPISASSTNALPASVVCTRMRMRLTWNTFTQLKENNFRLNKINNWSIDWLIYYIHYLWWKVKGFGESHHHHHHSHRRGKWIFISTWSFVFVFVLSLAWLLWVKYVFHPHGAINILMQFLINAVERMQISYGNLRLISTLTSIVTRWSFSCSLV